MFKYSAVLLTLFASLALAQSSQTVPLTGSVTITIPAPLPGPPGPAGLAPTPAAVAAACVASQPCIAAIAAAVAPVLSPPVTPPPPPVTPPAAGGLPTGSALVTGNGVFNWNGNFNYGGLAEQDNANAPDGSSAMLLTYPGSGGWQPFYQNPVGSSNYFDVTPYKFLNLKIWPSTAQDFQSLFLSSHDAAIPGALTVNFSSYGCCKANQWNVVKIPLGAGGYNINGLILKFNMQPTGGTIPNPLKVWVQYAYFSAT